MIINADNRDLLNMLPDNSVDAIVTDPPYGLSAIPDMAEVLRHWLNGDDYQHRGGGFMGKAWDSFVPGPTLWAECLRVLKPGGYLVAFSGARTYHLMTTAIALAGFEVRDQLFWLYGSGFPKSMNVGAAIEKKRHDRDAVLQVTAWIKEARDRAGLTNKAIDQIFGHNGMAGHWTTQGEQPYVPTLEQVPVLLAILGQDPPDHIAQLLITLNGRKGEPGDAYKAREVVGTVSKVRAPNSAVGVPGEGADYYRTEYNVTAPATEQGAQWAGFGTALKPAHEPITLARKPFKGPLADNVIKWGTGALNIDACRVPGVDKQLADKYESLKNQKTRSNSVYSGGSRGRDTAIPNEAGRFPANLLHDGSDEVSDVLPGVMRYFYHAKASRAERDRWLEHIEAATGGQATDRKDGTAGLDNPRAGAGRKGGARNIHPTVKPIAVMRWLIRLVTPPGGVVVDPYLGSGTTGIAAELEGFKFMGAEFDPTYFEIARARIEGAKNEAS